MTLACHNRTVVMFEIVVRGLEHGVHFAVNLLVFDEKWCNLAALLASYLISSWESRSKHALSM